MNKNKWKKNRRFKRKVPKKRTSKREKMKKIRKPRQKKNYWKSKRNNKRLYSNSVKKITSSSKNYYFKLNKKIKHNTVSIPTSTRTTSRPISPKSKRLNSKIWLLT